VDKGYGWLIVNQNPPLLTRMTGRSSPLCAGYAGFSGWSDQTNR